MARPVDSLSVCLSVCLSVSLSLSLPLSRPCCILEWNKQFGLSIRHGLARRQSDGSTGCYYLPRRLQLSREADCSCQQMLDSRIDKKPRSTRAQTPGPSCRTSLTPSWTAPTVFHPGLMACLTVFEDIFNVTFSFAFVPMLSSFICFIIFLLNNLKLSTDNKSQWRRKQFESGGHKA